MDQNEIEISGTEKQVLKAIEDLPKLVESISSAFNQIRTHSSKNPISEKSQPVKVRLASSATTQPKMYPSIKKTKTCSQAVLKLLETEWGAWRPRTMSEIGEGLIANAIHYPTTTLSGVLSWLVKKGKVRRWKTDAGFVYIMPGKEEA